MTRGAGFGYYRPPSSTRNWLTIYPDGFRPKFAPDVVDVVTRGAGFGYYGWVVNARLAVRSYSERASVGAWRRWGTGGR